jgi:hypothetical protein
VLCSGPDGWSLHAPEATEDEIAAGDAPYILRGAGKPSTDDYARAYALFCASYLAPGAAAAAHESAREWYHSYGAHVSTERCGDLCVQTVEYDWLDDDDDAVVARLRGDDPALSKDEARSLVHLARAVREGAEQVEAALAEALDCARRGDALACLDALDEASRIEREHGGDDPATTNLRNQLQR